MRKVIKSMMMGMMLSCTANASYFNVHINNESDYYLNNIRSVDSNKGNLKNLLSTDIDPKEKVDTAIFSTSWGQLSQNLKFDVLKNNVQVGTCNLHLGLGSIFANPDFTGSVCNLSYGHYLFINPSYQIRNGVYQVSYQLSKAKQFSRVIVFGDSMSDNGNLYKRSVEISLMFPISPILPVSPPYYSGRFTNGKVWVERLAEKFNIPENAFIDYAYAGATIESDILPIPNLNKQVSTYLEWNPTADPYALYTVWAGSNDLLRHLNKTDNELIETMSSNMEYNLRKLIARGAKNILSPQLPDLAGTPDSLSKDLENGDNSYTQRLTNLIKRYNASHRAILEQLRKEFPSVVLMTFDVYSFTQNAKNRAKDYGFTNIVDRCNPNYYWDDDLAICEKPKEYAYWDGVHPSASAHAILAEIMYQVVIQSGFTPRVKSLMGSSAALPDEVTERNKLAIDALNKEIEPMQPEKPALKMKSGFTGQAGPAQLSNVRDFSIILKQGIPLY